MACFSSGKSRRRHHDQAIDVDTGEAVEAITRDGFSQLAPTAACAAMIGGALVQFQLSDPDPATRREALTRSRAMPRNRI
jgi:urea transport system permease protein